VMDADLGRMSCSPHSQPAYGWLPSDSATVDGLGVVHVYRKSRRARDVKRGWKTLRPPHGATSSHWVLEARLILGVGSVLLILWPASISV
jgi:hypothetical protein